MTITSLYVEVGESNGYQMLHIQIYSKITKNLTHGYKKV